MLVDTDILIDFLRGKEIAARFIERFVDDIFISSITVAELFQGVIDGEERSILEGLIFTFTVLPITESIAIEGGLLRRQYKKSHGSGLADCLIAATALSHGLTLYTLNLKHYHMLSDIVNPYEKQ